MKKNKIIKNLGWIIAGILFLILAFKLISDFRKTPIKENIKASPTIKQESTELIKIIDGDTVIVKINGEEKSIRLIGIDTPEKNECFEKEATEKLKEIIANKKIKLEADNSQDDKDKYDRLLRYIYLEDGTLINKKLIEEGVAKEYTYKIAYKFQTEFKEAEKIAKEKKIGIWADGICNNF